LQLTIHFIAGFGDLVPDQPIYMMLSIIYLIFGLALASMCINVVQLKMSEHFKQASSKLLGASIAEAEAASQAASGTHSPTELQSIHSTSSGKALPSLNLSSDDKTNINNNK
jgi:potassium channel subfamily K member 18